MAFIGTHQLNGLLKQVISPFNQARIKSGAYELSVGHEVYVTDSPTGKKQVLDSKDSQIEIKPGQLALLITEEVLEIPTDLIAFISIKAGIKFKGLVNVSGFHVDPGFNGKLIFSVYNAGPATIMLDQGQPCFLIWFANITTTTGYTGNHANLNGIPSGYIEALKGNLVNPNALVARIEEIKIDLKDQVKDTERETNKSIEKLKNTVEWFKWVATVLVVLLLPVAIKLWFDNESYKRGYEFGLKEKAVKEEISNQIKSRWADSLIKAKIDSVKSKKQ
jgi:dCTP deaminase